MVPNHEVESAPPSPSPSIRSLPDAGSDLANLSDVSSLSDDDERPLSRQSDSEPEQLDDEDYTDITRSMIDSTCTFGESANSTHAITETESAKEDRQQRTPSASISLSAASLSHSRTSRVTARDLSYPDPSNLDGASPFGSQSEITYGLSCGRTARSLEDSISQRYSLIQTPKVDESPSQLLDAITAFENAGLSSTLTEVLLETNHEVESAPPFPSSSELSVPLAHVSRIEGIEKDKEDNVMQSEQQESAVFLLAPTKLEEELLLAIPPAANGPFRRAPHWKPVLACSLVGLIIAAGSVVYQGEQWRQTFPPASRQIGSIIASPALVDTAASSPRIMESREFKSVQVFAGLISHHVADEAFVPLPAASIAADESAASTSIEVFPVAASLAATAKPSVRSREARMASLPSVSALSSAASLGLSVISTHVSSALSLSPLHLGRSDLAILPSLAEDRSLRRRSKSATRKAPSSLSLASASSVALSVIPHMGQKSLSILSNFPNLTIEALALHPHLRGGHSKRKRKRSQAKAIVTKLSQQASYSYAVLKRDSLGDAAGQHRSCGRHDNKGSKVNTQTAYGSCKQTRGKPPFMKPRTPKSFRSIKCGGDCQRSPSKDAPASVSGRGRAEKPLFEPGFEDLIMPSHPHVRKILDSVDIGRFLTWLSNMLYTITLTLSPHPPLEQLGLAKSYADQSLNQVRGFNYGAMATQAQHFLYREYKQKQRDANKGLRSVRKATAKKIKKARKNARTLVRRVYRV